MARGQHFLDLRYRLRAETGRSTAPNVGVHETPALNALINEAYTTLYMKHDWPHLRKVFTKELNPGQRYYDFPDGLNPERVEKSSVKFNGFYSTLSRGIGFEQYATFDSEADERSDPVARWDIRWTGVTEQIEVWPIPISGDQSLRWFGIQAAPALVNDDDRCLLDDDLVILFAKVGLLPEKDRAVAADMAKAHFQTLRARTKADITPLSMADVDPVPVRPSKAFVVVR